MIVINWMNCNQGFVMGMLTLVYVGATILICIFNNKSAKAASKQLEAMKDTQTQNVNLTLFEKRILIYNILKNMYTVAEKTFDNSLTNPFTGKTLGSSDVFETMVYNDITDEKLKSIWEKYNSLIPVRPTPEVVEQCEKLIKERVFHIVQTYGDKKCKISLAKYLFPDINSKSIEDFVDAFVNTAISISPDNLQNLKIRLSDLKTANVIMQMENDLKFIGG